MTQPIPVRKRCSGLCTVHCPGEDHGERSGDGRGELAEYEETPPETAQQIATLTGQARQNYYVTRVAVADSLARLGYPEPAIRQAIDHAPCTRPEDGPAFLAHHQVAGSDENGYTLYSYPPDYRPAHIHDGDGTVEGCPGCFWELPDLAYELAYLLRVTEIVDRHLDEAAPEIYRQDNDASRLLNRWRRIAGGPASEGQEAVDALNEASGGNPRKGVVGDDSTILGELGDGVMANLLAIQSILKDTGATWDIVMRAAAKARSRVPDGSPS